MIKEFTISNFCSIKDEVKISFAVSKKDMLDSSSFKSLSGNYFNSIVTMIGNNGAGKSNILKALFFFLIFIHESYFDPDLYDYMQIMPHILSKEEPIKFNILFELDSKEYKYEIRIKKGIVIYEYLGIHNERAYSCIYEIKRENNIVDIINWKFKSKLNEFDKERFEKKGKSSLFSFLLSTGHLQTMGIDKITNYDMVSIGLPSSERLVSRIAKNPDKLKKIQNFIGDYGLGFEKIDIESVDSNQRELPFSANTKNIIFVHKSIDKTFRLPLAAESTGTRRMCHILDRLIPVLDKGGILICDEIETSIHPCLINDIIESFAKKNQNHAQILFSTHLSLLLNKRTKSQIYLIKKDNTLSTKSSRLDENKKVRNKDNFCNKYLKGEYDDMEKKWV